jgi:transposase
MSDDPRDGVDQRGSLSQVEIMKTPDDIDEMLHLHKQGWGKQRIADHLGISKNTVRRYLQAGGWTPYKRPQRTQTLTQLQDWLKDAIVTHHGNAAVLQQLLHDEHGVDVSLRTVQRAVAPYRNLVRAKKVATVRFETPPGQQMQVDFGETTAIVAGEKTRLHLCVMTLGYSRRIFVVVQPGQRQMHWLRSFEASFHYFGGVPHQMLVDNPRALVTHHNPQTREVVFNDTFRYFCNHWGITPRACAPYRARTKGKTDRAVRYVKENAIAGRTFDTFDYLHAHMLRWCREIADTRKHGTTGQAPIERFEQAEKDALQPINGRPPFERRRQLQRKVHNDSCVLIDTNAYSVPWRLIGHTLTVELSDGMVIVYAGETCVARHIETNSQRQRIIDPEHLRGVVRDTDAAAPEAPFSPQTSELARDLNVYAELAGGEW